MPRRISNILSSTLDDPQVNQMEATIFRIWRITFPHLPSRFGPAWNFYLDDLQKNRSKLLRRSRDSTSREVTQQHEASIRDATREIRRIVKQNKRTIILTILEAFSTDRINHPEFNLSKCCGALLPDSDVRNSDASDTQLRNLLSVMESDDSELAQLCAIVQYVPHVYLTRTLGQLFIRRFPHLQFPSQNDVAQYQLDQAVDTFLKRSHWHCRCASMCPRITHACVVK